MRPTFLLALIAAILLLPGCSDERIFDPDRQQSEDPEEIETRKEVAALASGAKTDDPEHSAAYDKAINSLILRGSKVETRLIDTLRSSPDAATRIGCVEVLTAIATKASIEHLVAVLDDEAPLVAQRSDIALRTLTGQRMIPEAGQPAKEGLPPVPVRPASDLAMDAEERAWAAWHAQHKAELKAAWERWWVANKAGFTLK
ncbi:MAG TPA: hypothetical protein DCS97_03715 [Planctomycetes bacterium]|nr:hypothetical protein [Planctomycetota bacterium]